MIGGSTLLTLAAAFTAMAPFASGQMESELTIEIYADTDMLLHKAVKSGECPAESFYWEHHPDVYGGYSGCVGEKFLYPCAQDAQGIGAATGAYEDKMPLNYDPESGECVETDYDLYNRTFWVLWGDPLDKEEILSRTGLYPTMSFPLVRGPYPRYNSNTDETANTVDDSNTAKALAKDFLVYLGAMPESEKEKWYVSFTEGAEHGISLLWAAMALQIAMTTCNRDIYVLMEAPAYGYSNGYTASWVNYYAGDFYVGEECTCYPDDCQSPTVTLNNVGWLPGTPLPTRTGGNNVTYVADSTSALSPWFESMVFPENPSGVIKTPQLQASRRVCDGVYVWPMYFGMTDNVVPLDLRPECMGWAYAVTKGYSASVRAGFITYEKEPAMWTEAIGKILRPTTSLSYGSISEMVWYGQMQIQQMMMSKPVDDPTGWVGAYTEIQNEKWATITDAFEDCPVIELTNSGAGAYAFFMYKEPYLGLNGPDDPEVSRTYSSFFHNVLGVLSTTYYWGFRGSDPADFYGEGYGTFDFTRMQLYRDINVYDEIARRVKIVCADTSASIGDRISVDDWATLMGSRRRLREEKLTTEEEYNKPHRRLAARRELVQEVLPHLEEHRTRRLLEDMEMHYQADLRVDGCAPDYTTSCIMDALGREHQDY